MQVETFCHLILGMEMPKSKSLANLVMGLASQDFAPSVVEIGLGSCYGSVESPLSLRLIPFESNRNSFTATQVSDLLDNKDLPFKDSLCINTLDSHLWQAYQLNQVDQWELPPDEQTAFCFRLSNGRKALVEIEKYAQMMIRTKRGKSMKDKPFDLVLFGSQMPRVAKRSSKSTSGWVFER